MAVHEIGHALGMYHEQSRPDRDKYVTIHWDNIEKGQAHNFNKYSYSIDSLGSPYDYSSIMHYGKRDFAWPPWKVTIEPKQRGAKIADSDLEKRQFTSRFRPIRRAIIHSAIREWEEFTCIRFKERRYEKDYIEFFVGKGCYSRGIGRVGGKQQISLGFGCITHGIAVHEIGHALGMYHEQSRPDRDKYVTIYWDNIQKGSEGNFYKYSHHVIDSLGIPYDYSSIMHYGKRELAWPPWKVTIEPKQSGVKIGQRRHLSTLDRKQMNMLYKCNRK
ncbi:unnamed protein product [Pocillopora meandrina]|uniref:Metalloendopeptidase n=1 Tax=Pocillopora meandrina TaxID=46732 RepID=A0AAU9W808_9CNID|nr:unnamed protein product [Pocillopora meandrina]